MTHRVLVLNGTLCWRAEAWLRVLPRQQQVRRIITSGTCSHPSGHCAHTASLSITSLHAYCA